jgi:hypothetical protein
MSMSPAEQDQKEIDNAEIEAFIESYGDNVAHYDAEDVRAFLHERNDNYDMLKEDEIADKHECYTSVLDAWGVWYDALKFAKQISQEMQP